MAQELSGLGYLSARLAISETFVDMQVLLLLCFPLGIVRFFSYIIAWSLPVKLRYLLVFCLRSQDLLLVDGLLLLAWHRGLNECEGM